MTEVFEPQMRIREFKNLDAALDFAKFVEPYYMSVERRLTAEGSSYIMAYQTSENEL